MAWTRKPRDTGDLDITASLSGITSGKVFLTRIGNQVWMNLQDVVITAPLTFVQWNGVIPAGYRPPTALIDLPLQGRGSADTAGPVRVSGSGHVVVYRPAGTVRGLVSWFTREAMPTGGA